MKIVFLALLVLLLYFSEAISPTTTIENTILTTNLRFPHEKQSVSYRVAASDLKHKTKFYMTLRFDRSSIAEEMYEDTEVRELKKLRVAVIIRDKYKFDCNIKFYPTQPSSQYCLKKFEITSYLHAPKVSFKFISGGIGDDMKPNFLITAMIRKVSFGVHNYSQITEPSSPSSQGLETYSSITEAFKSNSEFASLHNSNVNIDATTFSARKSGLLDHNQRKLWNPNSNQLEFTFNVDIVPKRRYFLSGKVHVTATHEVEDNRPSKLLQFTAAIDNNHLIRSDYIGDLDDSSKCLIMLSGSVTFRSCLEFFEITPSQIAANAKQPTANISVVWNFGGIKSDLTQWQMIFSCTLHILPNPLEKWQQKGISREMIECFTSHPHLMELGGGSNIGLLQISDGGRQISIATMFPPAEEESSIQDNNEFESIDLAIATAVGGFSNTNTISDAPSPAVETPRPRPMQNSLPSRLRGMERGIKEAVDAYLKETQKPFPDLEALLWPSDSSHINENEFGNCSVVGLPPIFGQNRDFSAGNLLVLAPDFSFFTDFMGGHDHGSTEDIWFDVVDAEMKISNTALGYGGKYSGQSFDSKSKTAIFRGKLAQRRFAYLRHSVSETEACTGSTLLNTSIPRYVHRANMCNDHQAVISIPGNGVWSWATKFNLLCNSVTMMVPPDTLNGESWETRMNLGLRPWIHYLPLTANKVTICQKLQSLVIWIRNHQEEAKAMAQRSRNLVLHKLNKEAVLKDVVSLLLDYAALNASLASHVA